MSHVGIIANPVSGKDIRRLVTHASVFDNHEKVNIIQRVLLALDALGVAEVSIMPDTFGLGRRAIDGIRLSALRAQLLDMPVGGAESDSTNAARRLREMGVGCIVVLGGDGTNRAVARECGDVPLVAVSTGTNNVFPVMVEGTIAGLAAGLVARDLTPSHQVIYRAKRLEVFLNGEMADIALVDVVTSAERFIGTRALWEPNHLRDIVLAQARPGQIGLSAIGACLEAIGARDGRGLHLRIGPGGTRVLAPIGPGWLRPIPIQTYQSLAVGETVALEPHIGTIALDGERSIEAYQVASVHIRLSGAGPRVVDIDACMAEATRQGVFERLARPATG